MTILTRAGKNYKCNACKTVIAKGSKHFLDLTKAYGTDRFCVNCIQGVEFLSDIDGTEIDLRGMVCEEKEAAIAELERDHKEGNL